MAFHGSNGDSEMLGKLCIAQAASSHDCDGSFPASQWSMPNVAWRFVRIRSGFRITLVLIQILDACNAALQLATQNSIAFLHAVQRQSGMVDESMCSDGACDLNLQALIIFQERIVKLAQHARRVVVHCVHEPEHLFLGSGKTQGKAN